MSFKFSQRSLQKREGVHPALLEVLDRAIELTTVDFCITEGLRTRARQKELFDAGGSKTMNSRHITGHAVDVAAIVGGQVNWSWPLYTKISKAMKQAAAELGVAIVWGGDWRTFKDGPHFELDRRVFP